MVVRTQRWWVCVCGGGSMRVVSPPPTLHLYGVGFYALYKIISYTPLPVVRVAVTCL